MLIDLNREELGFTKEAVETLMLADTSATRDQGDEAMRQQVILDWSKDEDPAAFFRELGDDQEEAERCVQRVFGLVEVHRRIEEALDPGEAEGKTDTEDPAGLVLRLEIDEDDLGEEIARHCQFIRDTFGPGFQHAPAKEVFERVLTQPFEIFARGSCPNSLPNLLSSYGQIKDSARIGKALADAREHQPVEGGVA